MSGFLREQRYLVFKAADLIAMGITKQELDQLEALIKRADEFRRSTGKPDLNCLVIESDWPEYESGWRAIEQRVNAENSDR